MVEFIIDNRETIKDLLKEQIPQAAFQNLTVGDYLFKLKSKPFLIIERKTISDYAASIRDGRGREQKKRLKSYDSECNILYLIEGNLTTNNACFNYNKIDKHTIVSSILNTIIRDRIQVFHTSNKQETIFVLGSIYNKLSKQGASFIENTSTHAEDIVQTAPSKKNTNITPTISFQMMLNCIPGVSNKVSTRIIQKYKTMHCFIETLSSVSSDKVFYIQSLKMNDEDTARKISKTAALHIVTYLGFTIE
jgi:ERCC4-type nuclease